MLYFPQRSGVNAKNDPDTPPWLPYYNADELQGERLTAKLGFSSAQNTPISSRVLRRGAKMCPRKLQLVLVLSVYLL